MKKWFGLCLFPWNRKPKIKDIDVASKSNNRSEGEQKDQTANNSKKRNTPNVVAFGENRQFVPRILNDARENEMENNLGAVSGMLGNLQSLANDMGSEIEVQNRQIDRINNKCGNFGLRIDAANIRAEKILKR